MSYRRTLCRHSVVATLTVLALTACADNAVVDVDDFGFTADCNLFSSHLAAGQNRDAIPALTLPQNVSANASFMQPDDRVLGVVVNGQARAYPFIVLWWHAIVNDILGDEPISSTRKHGSDSRPELSVRTLGSGSRLELEARTLGYTESLPLAEGRPTLT